MKKILIIIFSFLSIHSFAQKVNDSTVVDSSIAKFPRFYYENGMLTGVIFSIDQAQKIDNNQTLYTLYKSKSIGCDALEIAYKKVLNEMTDNVNISNIKISDLNKINTNQVKMISDLNLQIASYQADSLLASKQQDDMNKINKNLTKEINTLKIQKIVGFTVGGISIVGLLALSLHIIK